MARTKAVVSRSKPSSSGMALQALRKDPTRQAKIRAEAEEKDRLALRTKSDGYMVLRSATKAK